MSVKKKNTVTDMSIQKRQEFILNIRVQILGLLVVILCLSFNLAQSKSSYLVNYFPSQQITRQKLSNEDIPKIVIQSKDEIIVDTQELKLYALSACLMDASNGRVLYDKDAYHEMPMASTTKIMTLLVTLEKANLDDIVTVSSNAAKQPDVQLSIRTGEKYVLRDLLYSLMLESHNDTAVAIAEHVGGSVEEFCNMMTAKAKEIGADHTSFKTPNGLDEDGHYTTARDLCIIGSYAIQNEDFCNIVKTQTHQFNDVNGKRSFTVNNRDRFLYMMEGAIGIKTGYTGKAGYCFVGAIRINGKTLVSSVLGSGWPPHKEYKWSDTRKLMGFGLSYFDFDTLQNRITEDSIVPLPDSLPVLKGKENQVSIQLEGELSEGKMLLAEGEMVSTVLVLNNYVEAPLTAGAKVGSMNYYINNKLFQSIPVVTSVEVNEANLPSFFERILNIW